MKKKKTHGVQLLVRAVVTDPDGKIITDTGRKPARSFLIQFLEAVWGIFRGTYAYATALDGGEDYIIIGAENIDTQLLINAGAYNSDKGIVVGTGDTAVTNTDYKLETQLTEGVTAGKITHGAQIVGTAEVVGANVDLELKRAFTNNTGSTITVKEAGIYVHCTAYAGDHCIIRDVLAGGVDVPDKCSLTVYYTLRTTV